MIFFWLYRNYLISNLLVGVPFVYILIILIVLPFNTFTSYVSAIVIGVQRLTQYNLINIGRIYANLGFQCLSFYLGLGVGGAIGSWIASNLIAGGLAVWFIRDQVEFKKPASDTLIKDSFNYGSKNYFANLLNFANYRLDTFILNMFSGPSSVGIYSTSVSTAELVWYIPNSISDTLFIKSAASEKGGLAKLTSQVCRQSLIIVVQDQVAG